MENCERILSDCEGIPMNKPEEVLLKSAREAKSAGSSTVLVAYFDGQVLISHLNGRYHSMDLPTN